MSNLKKIIYGVCIAFAAMILLNSGEFSGPSVTPGEKEAAHQLRAGQNL